VQIGTGIKVNRIWYWQDDMCQPGIEGSSVDIRYDPHDMGHVYARINNHWVECESEYYCIFHGRSEREIKFASQEIKAIKGMHDRASSVYGKRLAEFLEQAEHRERLMEQRIKDAARRRIQEAHELRARGIAALSTDSASPQQKGSETLGSKIIRIPPAVSASEIGNSPLQIFSEF
jgi:hypothetical protein